MLGSYSASWARSPDTWLMFCQTAQKSEFTIRSAEQLAHRSVANASFSSFWQQQSIV
jgi:hypothetical protein